MPPCNLCTLLAHFANVRCTAPRAEYRSPAGSPLVRAESCGKGRLESERTRAASRPPTLPIYDCALQQLVSELEPGLPLCKPATAKRRPEPGVGRSGGPWRRSTTLQSEIDRSNRPRLLGIRGLDAADSGIDTRGPGEDLAKETATWERLFFAFLFKRALLHGLLH